jgi:hypothetical protein
MVPVAQVTYSSGTPLNLGRKGEQEMAYNQRDPDYIERDVVVERRDDGSGGVIAAVVIAALVVLGLIAYFGWWGPRQQTTNVTVEQPRIEDQRAQPLQMPDIDINVPEVNVPSAPPPTTPEAPNTIDRQ